MLMRTLALAIVTLLAATVLAAPSSAQISPGPLSRAHASLEGVRNCTQCHGTRSEPLAQRCLACHEEVAWLRERGRGVHAREAKGECASCHPEHAGRDFALIQWPDGSVEAFDHERAGWSLDGSHVQAKCSACHTSELRVSDAAKLSPREHGAGWIGLDPTCLSCHEDVHRGALDRQCESCHDTRKWKPAPRFDHASTRYPLTGRHARVECDACHLAPRLRPPRAADGSLTPVFRPVPFRACTDCHADPHRGRLRGACSDCHTTASFSQIREDGFDHDRTRFPLRGGHAAVRCAACHEDASGRRINPRFSACAECHADPHPGGATLGGARVDCAACHVVATFSPSTVTLAQHQRSAYPLEGAHVAARCPDCHVSTGSGAGRRVEMRPRHASCADCHLDPHEGRLSSDAPTARPPQPPATTRAAAAPGAAGCASCHDLRGFRPSRVDVAAHAAFAFALEGAHRAVPCVTCHAELARPPLKQTLATRARAVRRLSLRVDVSRGCAGCHESPHGDQFARRAGGGTCESCHDSEAFVPASRFDHGRSTTFPLTGGHAGVPCAGCHRPGRPGTTLVYAIPVRCESCHGAPPPRDALTDGSARDTAAERREDQ